MTSSTANGLAIALFSEILATDHAIRNRVAKSLPKGMELSHFAVLNHLAGQAGERSPAQLAQSFGVTRGAMSNTLRKLTASGFVHIRPDWDDARRKMVALSPSGRAAREDAIRAISPLVTDAVADLGEQEVRTILPVLRALRKQLSSA